MRASSPARSAPDELLRIGFACMGTAAVANLAYNTFYPAALPWAVLPIMVYALGLGLSMPLMSLATLDQFPAMRGLAASLITFVQMLVFSLISGVVAPLTFGSPARLAAVVVACFAVSITCWRIADRGPRAVPETP